jgi:tetratricopeptide (TPR) repeat protein
MNKNQFVVYSFFTVVVSIACAFAGTTNGAWFIGAVAALFTWAFIFMSDRYAGQRTSILKIVVGLPIGLALIAFCVYRFVQTKESKGDSFTLDLSSYASQKVTGNGSLTAGSFSGTLYNGSNWEVRSVRFVVTAGKDSRKFDQQISISPRSTSSFYFQTGQNQTDKVSWSMEEIKGIPPKSGPQGFDLLPDADKNELHEIEGLLPLTFTQRIKKMPGDKMKQRYFFWVLTSTTDIKSDIFLHDSIATFYEDREHYDSALSENEKALPLVEKDSAGLSYGIESQIIHQRILRELGRLEEALEEGQNYFEQSQKLNDAKIPGSYAVSLEEAGKYWKAIDAWKMARKISANGPDRKEGIGNYYILSPQDRMLLKSDQYRFTDSFMRLRINQLRFALLLSFWPEAILLLLGGAAAWHFRGRRSKGIKDAA